MSNKQGPDDPIDHKDNDVDESQEDLETLAFEYTSGLLRGSERAAFEAKLENDTQLQSLVSNWEENLMLLAGTQEPLAPKNQTWNRINQHINPTPTSQDPPLKWVWALFGAMCCVFVLLVFPVAPGLNPVNAPNLDAVASNHERSVDYVAVMTNDSNQPSLTTFGDANTKELSLHWQLDTVQAADDSEDFQLWAVSKRDGQTRSIGILEDQNRTALKLSPATWRLITDAQTLVLTREDAGGSAIDEPSDSVIASGVCVRINRQQS